MSFMLYKNGDKHVIFGKKCTYQIFADDDVENALKNGWYLHPSKLPQEEVINGETVLTDDIIEAEFEEVDTNKSGKLSNEEVRSAAEKAGIDGFEKKQIKTLKKELGL